MKKVKTIHDITTDPRVEYFVKNYDGQNKHSVILRDGFRFSNTEGTQDIGTVKELCESMNNWIEKIN